MEVSVAAPAQTSTRVETFLVAVGEEGRRKGRRLSWDERVALIYDHFPGCKNPNWNVILDDLDTLGEVVRDILRIEQAVPGKSGPRPSPDVKEGMKSFRKLNGDDHTILPFSEAFKVLAGQQSRTQLARKTGIARTQVHRLLHGDCDPSPQEINQIARAFGKEPSYFLEFRTAFIMAALGARLEMVPEATIGLYRKVVKT
jgi:transcriptional regulator with XRE-family HTH domain